MSCSPSNVRIHGKSQSRTVLGIVNAYLIINPDTTVDELRQAFPGSVTHKFAKWDASNPDPMKREGLFHVIETEEGVRKWKATGQPIVATTTIFEQADETIHLKDGTEVAMESTWVADDYKAMVEWAKKYGIEVASFEKADGGFVKGSFTLEYLQGFIPVASAFASAAPIYQAEEKSQPEPQKSEPQKPVTPPPANPATAQADEPKREPAPIWPMVLAVLLALLAVAVLLWLHTFCACHDAKPAPQPQPEAAAPATTESAEPDTTAVAVDTLTSDSIAAPAQPDTQTAEEVKVKEVELKFNSITFGKGAARLTPEMKRALIDLVKAMEADPEMRLSIIGHSSADGNEDYNKRLSTQRAKAIYDHLTEQGISKKRLKYEGRGSIEPISDVPELNRRTELKVER